MATKERDYHRIMDFVLGIAVFFVLAIVIVVVVHENKRIKEENTILSQKYDSTLSKQLVYAMGLPQGNCTTRECLIRDDRYGLATIEGYYQEVGSCDGFVVTGGSEKFIANSLALAEETEGSLVQTTEAGDPIIHLDTSYFSEGEDSALRNSSAESDLRMIVLAPMKEVDTGDCASFVEVLRIN